MTTTEIALASTLGSLVLATVLAEIPAPPPEAPLWKRLAYRFLVLFGASLKVGK